MSQIEYVGAGSILKISEIILKEQPQQIFLVHGKTSYECCGAQAQLSPLLVDKKVKEFSDFTPNPTIEAVEIAKRELQGSDLVIAIGGGTAMDIAKLANIFAANPHAPIDYIHKKKTLTEKGSALVAVPTTAGSGSEATHFAVVYVNKSKYSVADKKLLLPDYVILDPTLSESLPPAITAATGIDALAQAMESYWSVHSTDESKEYARQAIGLVLDHLEGAVNSPSLEHREGMLTASNLAGKAINLTKTTAPHALSYAFTSHHGIPHGHAVGLTLPEIFVHNSHATSEDVVDSRGAEYVQKNSQELAKLLGCKSSEQARDFLYSLMNSIGLKTKLSDLGIGQQDIRRLVDGVNYERLKNNPRVLTKDFIEHMYSHIIIRITYCLELII